MKDLEASTVQKRPAYRYIRKADNVPTIGATEDQLDPLARIKLFDPCGSWTWFVVEYDQETRTAFGLVDGFEREVGCFNMAELVELRGPLGLPIERDLSFRPRPLSECA